jgi:hypothetical protein
MNIETNAVAIRRSIRNIGTARTKLVDLIQQCALAVIQHAHVHGDVTLASDLCLAVGNGMKHEALRVYLSKFGPMEPNADKETKGTAPMKYSKGKRLSDEALADQMVKAAAEMWYAAPTEKSAEEFSFALGLHKLLDQLEKALASGYAPSDEEQAVIAAARNVPKPAKKAKETYEPSF